MGFDLKPRNKAAGFFHMGAFSWHWMLEAGVGLPFCYGKGIEPAQFVYGGRKDGLCIGYNDGARITASEARTMATLARWVADYQDAVHRLHDEATEEARKRWESDPHRIYSLPVRRDFIKLARDFADWAEKSGGFRVY
jgi:hypothetical protein